MVRQAISSILVAAMLLSGIGCGTIANLISEKPEIPYGGVQTDLKWFMTPSNSSVGGGDPHLIFLVAAELCLSFVADTLTLPLAVYIIHRE
jgi:uncharacterized protein YceK